MGFDVQWLFPVSACTVETLGHQQLSNLVSISRT